MTRDHLQAIADAIDAFAHTTMDEIERHSAVLNANLGPPTGETLFPDDGQPSAGKVDVNIPALMVEAWKERDEDLKAYFQKVLDQQCANQHRDQHEDQKKGFEWF